ncbi:MULTISPECIES: DUF4185 domain-containing protein [unclassified Streptomyces]|uniref:DUF4185 domain-containing protein n=1 Tax=unclassified Streptomyces TaxID=2593676 RepID=UPI003830C790
MGGSPGARAVGGAGSGGRRGETDGLVVTKVADLTGPGITSRFRMEAADLGIPVRTPDGRLLFVFGDTFEEPRVGGGWWRSPVALYASMLDGGEIVWTGAVGGKYARQLRPYEDDRAGMFTVLPTDVITIGADMFLHVAMHRGFGNVVGSEIWRSHDSGASWHRTAARFPGGLHGGLFQLLTWGLGSDGYVYVYSTGFQRDKPVILHRVPADEITDPAAYQPWGRRDGVWGWGRPPTPVLEGKSGEMCLRPLAGRWVLTWFNAGEYRIDAAVVDTPMADLSTAYRRTLIRGGTWGHEDDSHVAQLYGGYIIPGSTLDDLHLSVSQWNTAAGWPYRAMQFHVQGLTA